jgi:hypothetical protein
MNPQRKIALGGALAAIAGAGITLSAVLGWSSFDRPWGFGLGFVFGVASGAGVVLALSGLLGCRQRAQVNPQTPRNT